MRNNASTGVRGAQPPRLSLNEAERKRLVDLEQRLQVGSVHLHPLLQCVPIPDVFAQDRNKLQKEFNSVWKIPVAMVVNGKNHFILTDSIQLSLWLALGRSMTTLLKNSVEVSEADALAWYLTHHVPKTWAKFHRAATAVLLAAQAHKQFRSLSLPDGTKPDTVNAFLGNHVAVSPRLVAQALELLRLRAARFRRALAGQRRALTKQFLDRAVAPGSRAKKIHITKVDYLMHDLEFKKTATLAIADLDLVPATKEIFNLLLLRLDQEGLVVFIGNKAEADAQKLIQHYREDFQLRASKPISCLASLKLSRDRTHKGEERPLVILYFNAVYNERKEKIKFSSADKNSKLIKTLNDLKILSTCSYPLNARKARILLYERLLKQLASAKDASVLALCNADIDEERKSRSNKTRIFLSCLKSAAGRSGHRNLIFCHFRLIEDPDIKPSLRPQSLP